MTAPEKVQARLDEIRARVRAATAAPWRVMSEAPVVDGREHVGVEAVHVERWNVVATTGHPGEHPQNVPDAEFIAGAREDVPWLLAEVAQLRAELAAALKLDDLATQLAAADLAWSREYGDELATQAYIRHLADTVVRLRGAR